MLREAENELIDLLNASPIAARLRGIGTMPLLPESDLVKHFALEAPALYVDSASFQIPEPRLAHPRFTVLASTRQVRPQRPGKSGDGIAIGLHDLVDAVLSVVDGVSTPSFGWRATAVSFAKSPEFSANGFCLAFITLETSSYLDGVDDAALADFITFHADYDAEPHEPRAEHEKWLKEPPDHATSAPDLSDQLKVRKKP